ncbi:BppU family phage baseplate upper protein [Enterococcus thailandicus]|uniref:BppU family phage baseplate upper protein n=1 Tax=Enterococcus thailandicus TaxID=417368 RepID=UPI003B5A05B1
MVYKLNESLIKIQAEAINPIQTNVVFWSHDRSTAKLRFKLMKDGVAQSLPEGTIVPIRLKFRSGTAEGGYGSHDYLATIEDRVNGIVSIVIKDNLLGYIGKIEGSIYIEFPNDQSLDTAGRFIFDIKRSPIDATTQEVDDYYFEGFEEVIDRLEAIKAEMDALDYKSFQKHKLTVDDGRAMRLADLNPKPATIDDLTRPGFYYITSAESNTFIPADHYIRQTGMAGSGWITIYPGDTGGGVVQEWYRNTANAVVNTRHLYRKQESVSPVTWNPWSEYAQTNSTMLSSSYYQGAAHRLAEATITGKQATSYLELSENTGIYYLTTNESKAMSDFTQLPPEFIYGVFVENIPNATINNFLQRITSNVIDGVSQPPVTYWRVIQKKADGYTPTKWRKVVSQDDAQMYKLTKDNGQSFRLEDLNPAPTSLEDWARKFKGFFYIPNSSLKTMTDFSTLPASFASSHVHMLVQAGAGFDYALQTLTQYQAPYRQLYRVVTNTAVLPWQSVANLAEVVNTTEPQSVGGLKNFLEVPTVKNSKVVTISDLDKTAITTISNKDGEISDFNLNGATFGFGSEIQTTGTKASFSRNTDKKIVCQVAGTYLFNGQLNAQVRAAVSGWHYVDMRVNGESVGSPWARGAESFRNRWNFSGMLQVKLKIGDVIDFISSSSETGATSGQFLSCPLAAFQRIGD